MGGVITVCEQPDCEESVVWMESGPDRMVLVNFNSLTGDDLMRRLEYRPEVHVLHSATCAQRTLFPEALDREMP